MPGGSSCHPAAPPPHPAQVLRLQALLDASSRARNTLCVLCTLGLGAWMALNNSVTLGTCYSFFVFSFRSAGPPACCWVLVVVFVSASGAGTRWHARSPAWMRPMANPQAH